MIGSNPTNITRARVAPENRLDCSPGTLVACETETALPGNPVQRSEVLANFYSRWLAFNAEQEGQFLTAGHITKITIRAREKSDSKIMALTRPYRNNGNFLTSCKADKSDCEVNCHFKMVILPYAETLDTSALESASASLATLQKSAKIINQLSARTEEALLVRRYCRL